jgi:hypothetical protein
MNRLTLLSLIALTLAAGTAQASTVSYAVFVDTTGISAGPGYIELQFDQANTTTSGVGAASISQFLSTGYTLGGAAPPSAGVTGSFAAPPVVIPNDQGPANYYDEIVTSWGQSFSFLVTLDTAATDSEFFVYLLDSGFNPIVSPLGQGEVANVFLDSDGVPTSQGSSFTGGSATVSPAPEPASGWLLAAGLGTLLLAFRRGSKPRA